MRIPLDRNGPPLYRQIQAYVSESIASGGLPPGTRLPASRSLASDLGVSRITVENAYAELEADGLVARGVGSGTFVSQRIPLESPVSGGSPASWPLWQLDLGDVSESWGDAGLIAGAQPARPGTICMATGNGDPRLFPVEDFRKAMQTVIRRDGLEAFEYAPRTGYAPLRSTIAHVLSTEGLNTQPDDVLITSGSQQVIALVTELLLKQGDFVVTENPTYGSALALFRSRNLRIASVPVDDQGMQVERLEELLQRVHPRLIYTMPNFQNPSGVSMSTKRRHMLVMLAQRYNVPVLEDDFVGDLRYEGRAQPAVKALDPGGHVIYTSTFSKMLLPGLRVGFAVAHGPVRDRLINHKHLHDLGTSNLIQRSLNQYITLGRYEAHLRRARRAYRKRRDAMLMSLSRYLPGASAAAPAGGIFVWLQLPVGLSSRELLWIASDEGVTFAPGADFFAGEGEGERFMRLNFASQAPDQIEEGIRRLGKAMSRLAST